MSRTVHWAWRLLLAATLLAARARAAGLETFANFPITGSSYTSGSFTGQDGSTWTFVECQGGKVIQAPTPGLAKGETPASSVASGTLTGGCGTLSFDWMQFATASVNLDVLVNDTVRHTITGGVIKVTNHVEALAINVGGNFTLKLQQHNFSAGQVAIDNIAWTSYGGAAPAPPVLLFSPDTNSIVTAFGNPIQLDVTATEPNVDTVRLWAADLPAGASFNATTGATPLLSSFSWTPAAAQTGLHSVVFLAGDKDGTNSRAFSIDVTPIYPYYHYAIGLAGPALKAKLHDIISAGALQLTDNQENVAMKVLHTHPDNTNNVYYLYNTNSSVPKSLYNENGGWNKEHCWPESRGLGSTGPDQVDVHNLFAEDKGVNALRGNLHYDESDPADPGFRSPATNPAPETSMDSDSFEPPPASKGNVARGIFYMATRYDGSAPDTSALWFSDDPSHTNSMGKLTTLLLWHAMDPPDALESNKNELIHARYQHNRNPFIDHPEWAEAIWGVDPDGDGVTDTHELISGTSPHDSNSVFQTSLSGSQITCGALSSGSTWRLYQGSFVGSNIAWRPVAQTNRLHNGSLRFDVAPTSPATFFHLRAIRP